METQTMTAAHTVTVFGSATIRTAPDVAIITFTVSNTNMSPVEAFSGNRTAAQKIQTYLTNAKITDAGVSQVQLSETHDPYDHRTFIGYTASTNFQIRLDDLDRLEEILVGIVEVGASHIQSVSFQTTQLKAVRADARRQAILAAREKAEIYCEAAGVRLGEVLQIEDRNPDSMRWLQRAGGHLSDPEDASQEAQAFNPSSIAISGTVDVVYAILPAQNA